MLVIIAIVCILPVSPQEWKLCARSNFFCFDPFTVISRVQQNKNIVAQYKFASEKLDERYSKNSIFINITSYPISPQKTHLQVIIFNFLLANIHFKSVLLFKESCSDSILFLHAASFSLMLHSSCFYHTLLKLFTCSSFPWGWRMYCLRFFPLSTQPQTRCSINICRMNEWINLPS